MSLIAQYATQHIVTNPAMKPRWYQDEAVTATLDYFMRGNAGNPVICLPTGSGKSLVQAEFMVRVLSIWPRQRFLCLTHVKELVAQNAADCLEYWPTAPIGIYSAGLNKRTSQQPIIFGGVASVINCIELFGWRDVLFIDECHLVSGKDASLYMMVIAGLRKINPNLKVIGLTATPYRQGQGLITDGALFTDIVYDMTTMAMFNLLLIQGYLCPLRPKSTKLSSVEIDVSNVGSANGDYKLAELQAASDVDAITDAAVREMCREGQSKTAWLTYASGVKHAENINEKLLKYGVPSGVIHGDMPRKVRDDTIDAYRQGKLLSIVNYGVLTTGFNHKAIDMISHLRATESTGLWVQTLGRGTRPVYALGYDLSTDIGRFTAIERGPKPFCLVLDFAGNTKRLGPINDPVIPRKKGKKLVAGVAPVKICPQCGFYNHTRTPKCDNCGYIFPQTPKIDATAAIDELLRTEAARVETYDVAYVLYGRGEFKHTRPYMHVMYYVGERGADMFDERVWLENDGDSYQYARRWWGKRFCGDGTARRPQSFAGYLPTSVSEALTLTNQLKTPRSIRVKLDKKEPMIIGHDF